MGIVVFAFNFPILNTERFLLGCSMYQTSTFPHVWRKRWCGFYVPLYDSFSSPSVSPHLICAPFSDVMGPPHSCCKAYVIKRSQCSHFPTLSLCTSVHFVMWSISWHWWSDSVTNLQPLARWKASLLPFTCKPEDKVTFWPCCDHLWRSSRSRVGPEVSHLTCLSSILSVTLPSQSVRWPVC